MRTDTPGRIFLAVSGTPGTVEIVVRMKQKSFFSFKFFVPGFTILFGLVLVVLAVMRVVQTESFINRAEQTRGTVITSRQGILIWSAVVTVSFPDTQGFTRKTEFETGSGTTSLKTGDSLNLLYDTADTSYVYFGNPRLKQYPVAGIYFFLGGCLLFFTLRRFRGGTAGAEKKQVF